MRKNVNNDVSKDSLTPHFVNNDVIDASYKSYVLAVFVHIDSTAIAQKIRF